MPTERVENTRPRSAPLSREAESAASEIALILRANHSLGYTEQSEAIVRAIQRDRIPHIVWSDPGDDHA